MNGQVRLEVQRHCAANPALRHERYPLWLRMLRSPFDHMTFARWLGAYAAVCAVAAVLEWTNHWVCSGACPLTMPDILLYSAIKLSRIKDVALAMVTVQVGVLGVLTLAVSLVTLIGQREHATADVMAYFHESLAQRLSESALALSLVLIVQLAWPLEFLSHRLGVGSELLSVQIGLTIVHMLWLGLNLLALAHFIVTSLRFSQPQARPRFRKRFVANVVVPADLFDQLWSTNYERLGRAAGFSNDGDEPVMAVFGAAMGATDVMISRNFREGQELSDLWQAPLIWALRRYRARTQGRLDARERPGGLIAFPADRSEPLTGQDALCLGRGAAAFSWIEKQAIRASFRFKRSGL